MPAVTRAMSSARGRRGQAAAGASSSASQADPTRQRSTRQRQQAAQRSGRRPAPAQSRAAAEDNDDADAATVASSEDEEEARPAQVIDSQRAVVRTLAVFHPDFLLPEEFEQQFQNPGAQSHASRLMLTLAGTVHRIINGDPQRLNLWREQILVGGPAWTTQLVANMRRRFSAITAALQESKANPNAEQRVVQTVDDFRRLVEAIQNIRRDYFAGLTASQRSSLGALLVGILRTVVNNGDQYAGRGLPFAGEGIRSQRRLLSCFLSADSRPQVLLINIVSFHTEGYIQGQGAQLRSILQWVQYYQDLGADQPDAVPEGVLRQTLNTLAGVLQRLMGGG